MRAGRTGPENDAARNRVGGWTLTKSLAALGPARRCEAQDGRGRHGMLLVQRRRPGNATAFAAWRALAQRPPPPHPGLLPVLGFAEDAEHFALVIEGREARSLASWFVEDQPTMSQCLAVFCRLVDATQALHGAGLVHGAIRPDTVLIDAGGDPLLLGPGGLTAGPLGRRAQAGLEAVYQAPELVVAPVAVEPHCDVYALGCLLYFLGVGAHPWGAGQSGSALVRKKRDAAFDPPLATSRVPTRELVEVLHLCTKASPTDRPPDAGALAPELAARGLWSQAVDDTFDAFHDFFATGSAPALPVLEPSGPPANEAPGFWDDDW